MRSLATIALACSVWSVAAAAHCASPGTTAKEAVSADFDGDGRADRADLVRSGDTYELRVCFAQDRSCAGKPLATGPAAHLETLHIKAIDRSVVAPDLPQLASGRGEVIDLYAEEASSTIYYWNGKAFAGIVRGD
jgi:hypothetical protein